MFFHRVKEFNNGFFVSPYLKGQKAFAGIAYAKIGPVRIERKREGVLKRKKQNKKRPLVEKEPFEFKKCQSG